MSDEKFAIKWYDYLGFVPFSVFSICLLVMMSPMLLVEYLWNMYIEMKTKLFEEKHGKVCSECKKVL